MASEYPTSVWPTLRKVGDMMPVRDKTGYVIGFDVVTSAPAVPMGQKSKSTSVFIPVSNPSSQASTTTPQITRQSVDTTPITQTKDTPATSTTVATTPASTTQSSQLTPQNMPVALEQAGRDTTGSVILGGGAGTGGAYQGVADVPLGAAGQDNQFLRRAGSILLR